jgi:hypothetical protein
MSAIVTPESLKAEILAHVAAERSALARKDPAAWKRARLARNAAESRLFALVSRAA